MAPITKDSDLRGIVLRKFYDTRRTSDWTDMPVNDSIDGDTSFSICTQLGEHGLIHWRPVTPNRGFARAGVGKITAAGIDVIEENTPPPIAITIQGHLISGSSNVQIGERNVQGLMFSGDKISVAIDHSNANPEQKAEAKSLLASVLGNPVLAAILKGFTGG